MEEPDPLTEKFVITDDHVQPPSKEEIIAKIKAKKIASLVAHNAALETNIANTQGKLKETTAELKCPALETVKTHIRLLHEYNEIRDIGQGLIGLIADKRGVRIREVNPEFGIEDKD